MDLSKAYVHWLGKGDAGRQEWVFRMYSLDNTVGRANRISFYVFNADGGLGVGSHYQDPNNPVQVGSGSTSWGRPTARRPPSSSTGRPSTATSTRGRSAPKREGPAPHRHPRFHSYFEGEIREVRIWNRALTLEDVAGLYGSGSVPQQGFIAEYLLTRDIAPDTADTHDGRIQRRDLDTGGGRRGPGRGKPPRP